MSLQNPLTPPIDFTKAFSLEAGKDRPADRAKLATMAQEFEAMLLLQMVRQMRQSMLEDEDEPTGLGNETMTETFDVEFSRYLAKAGGIGLQEMIKRQIEKTTGVDADKLEGKDGNGVGIGMESIQGAPALVPLQAAPTVLPIGPALVPLTPDEMVMPLAPAGGAHPPGPLDRALPRQGGEGGRGGVGDVSSLAMPLESDATSSFGWRADPLNGKRKFHAGVDLRAAYGTDVPVAAAGKVTFAGERGGYGLMVTVEHENGVETRYAHLASTAVQAGQAVSAGEVVGRVGSTGRSTGPHLHFEVLRDGERIDPEDVAVRRPTDMATGGS